MTLDSLHADPALREKLFPIVRSRTFLAHAGVAILPGPAADALRDFAAMSESSHQEDLGVWRKVTECRQQAAKLLGAKESEIALLGPTALGLSLVANGLDWQPDDEVVCYLDDYPANVYPWLALKRFGVKPVLLQPSERGHLDWELLEKALTPKTKLVALASANFISGYRIDIPGIGQKLRERGILFCVDGIQTLGAFPTTVEHVDFLSADSHKWMLGPVGAGVFYVRESLFDTLRPTLLGSWNVQSPDFVAQPEIAFYEGARRYEPGTLNIPGIFAMLASVNLILEMGVENIAAHLIKLRHSLNARLIPLGFRPLLSEETDPKNYSGIVTFVPPAGFDIDAAQKRLEAGKITVSWRKDRAGITHLRVSPHFYNNDTDTEQLIFALCAQS
jgi:selenocysteine lyase/cysteine desulfurase